MSTLPTVTIVALLLAPALFAAQEHSRLTGRVTDESGGALPGVTVSVMSPRLDEPRSVVTDDVGRYLFATLPPDSYAVKFAMSGFEAVTTPHIELRAGEMLVVDRQLDLAPLTETVTVLGSVPAAPEPTPADPPPPLRPRPQIVPVAKEALASVCGPGRPTFDNLAVGHIVGHRDEPTRQLFGDGDILILDVGADQTVISGQNFVVRRRFRTDDKTAPVEQATYGEHTAGLIQVVETSAVSSVAMVVYACDELMSGDDIEPFDAVPQLAEGARGAPQFDEPAQIIFGDEGRTIGAPRQLMVIDQGANQGVVRGQRLTIFRRPRDSRGARSTIGEGIVVAVRLDGATIRLERTSDAVAVGDLVALHR
ncbi:MAG: carboxypeptidase-like regulatory domain-containing protein [Acidobacteria bacterium]|nr:carboxypeptidase-like regulatory domain-containing protein [Acidobacteriota bacterium]